MKKLNWSSVRKEHLDQAISLVRSGKYQPRVQAKGILVMFDGDALPAKYIAKLAYQLANGLEIDGWLDFTSGDRIVRLFEEAGYSVKRTSRRASRTTADKPPLAPAPVPQKPDGAPAVPSRPPTSPSTVRRW